MTEEEARSLVTCNVSRETSETLDKLVSLVRVEAMSQNLISASTVPSIWHRHILDSAQLIRHAPAEGDWLDIGSGAGFPGLVVAILSARQMVLVEPRTKRAMFLAGAVEQLGLVGRVRVIAARAEAVAELSASVISARAVASLPELFAMGLRFARADTCWLLPKGRTAAAEVASARRSWHARMSLVPSITDSEASIVIASDVSRRSRT